MQNRCDLLDQVTVAEYVPTGMRCELSCAVFRTVQNSTATTGTKTNPKAPEAGSLGALTNPAIGIFPRATGTPSEVLTNGTMTATIADTLTKTTLYRFEEVRASSYNFSVTARGIVAQNCRFNCIRIRQEDETT